MKPTTKQNKVIQNNNKLRLILLGSSTVLVGWQGANILLLKLLGLSNTPMPWSFLIVLGYGFYLPVAIAFLIVFCPLIACYFWWQGGLQRAIAETVLLTSFAFILLSWLGLYLFLLWEGLTLPPYPWLAYTLFLRLPLKSTAFYHLLISEVGSFSLLFIALVFKIFSAKTKAEKVFGKAHFANAFEIHRAGLYSKVGIVLGRAYGKKLRLPGFESVLVVAPTGAGKTTAIAVPNLLEWTGSGVFNDLKGELYRLTGHYRKNYLDNECYIWAPADSNKTTACYNPFFYVSQNPDLRIRDLQLIAETLIPETKLGDGFWYQSSREVFLTLSLYLLETQGIATLSKVHDLSKQDDFFVWLLGEIRSHEDEFSKPLQQNAFAILGADEKTQRNILKDFHSRMQLFNDPIVGYATSKNDFDFRELRRQKISIYIQIPDSDKTRLSPILTLFWAQLINELSAHEPTTEEPYGVLTLLDEFGNMARINKLKDGMSFLRSYHMRCILIVQYLAQITAVYGRDDAKGFLNSKVKIAFALNDTDDAQFFSKALGNKTVKVSSSSVSTGHGEHSGSRTANISYQPRPLMHPDELMQLSHKKAVILMEAKNPIRADKCYWFKSAQYRKLLNFDTSVQQEKSSHEPE